MSLDESVKRDLRNEIVELKARVKELETKLECIVHCPNMSEHAEIVRLRRVVDAAREIQRVCALSGACYKDLDKALSEIDGDKCARCKHDVHGDDCYECNPPMKTGDSNNNY